MLDFQHSINFSDIIEHLEEQKREYAEKLALIERKQGGWTHPVYSSELEKLEDAIAQLKEIQTTLSNLRTP